MKTKNTYGVRLWPLWISLFLLRFRSKGDGRKAKKVERRLAFAHEATISKLAQIAKGFVIENETLLRTSVPKPIAPEVVPALAAKSEESIRSQKKKIADIAARNAQAAATKERAETSLKELEVKKVELADTFAAVFARAKSYTDVYLTIASFFGTTDFTNPFESDVPQYEAYISLKDQKSDDQEDNSDYKEDDFNEAVS